MSINTLKEINERAIILYEDLENHKAEKEKTGAYVESFRIYCINELNKFFSEISKKSNSIDYYTNGNKNNQYPMGIVKFIDAPSPFDIELICTKQLINIPLWFKKICIKYLNIQFEKTDSLEEIRCTDAIWLWQSIDAFEKTIEGYRCEGENILKTIDRLGEASNKFNLFGSNDKPIYDKIEFEGLIHFLKEDFDIYGWDIESRIGLEDYTKDSAYLNFRLDDIRFELYKTYLEIRQNHPPSKSYKIIQNSVHETNRKHLMTPPIG